MRTSKRRSSSSDLTPAPGRTPFDLGEGFTAVILRPVPNLAFEVVGLFQGDALVDVIDEPNEVRWWARMLRLGRAATEARRLREERRATSVDYGRYDLEYKVHSRS